MSLKDDAYEIQPERAHAPVVCCTMCIRHVDNKIRDRQLEHESLQYIIIQYKQGCVNRLNTEGGRGSVSWLIHVKTRKDYARRIKLCIDFACS